MCRTVSAVQWQHGKAMNDALFSPFLLAIRVCACVCMCRKFGPIVITMRFSILLTAAISVLCAWCHALSAVVHQYWSETLMDS